MKIVNFNKYIVVLSFILLFQYYTIGQSLPLIPAPFECVTDMSSSSSLQGNSTCTADFLTHYNNAPIINVYVNVHVWNTNENLPNATLINRVRQMITHCNETLDNMQQNYPTPTQPNPAPRVEDAKFRLKLYSDPATNSADINGGIWVYPTLMFPRTTDITTILPNTNSFPGYQRQYANVIDIFLVNYGAYQITVNGQLRWTANNTGYVFGTESAIGVMADLNGAFQADALNGTTNQNDLIWRSVARALNHEIAHILSLRHTFECNGANNCPDINVARECGSNCSGFQTCGGTNNGQNCPGTTTRICRYGASWNIMAYDWWQYTITRCQWDRIYNYAINTNYAPVRDCPTTTALTLTTSPLPDYRASQQITSTSTINTGRDVTYQSALIRLNAGFRVAGGATFFASPSTFPCCDAPPASLITQSESEASNFNLNNNNIEKSYFQIFPNPFDNEIIIRFLEDSTFYDQEDLRLDIIDINGKTVHSLIVIPQQYEAVIDTKNFLPGLYIIRLSGESLQQSYQIVKI